MKKIASVAIIAAAALASNANAQSYEWGIGAHLGPNMGFTAKKFISSRSALEGIFSYDLSCNAPTFSFLYEYHIPLANSFNMLMGGGMNIGAQHVGKHRDGADFLIGVSPVLGLEYKVASAPLALGFDYQPQLNFAGHSVWDNFAFKVRYAF
ncbi:MAG: hypothetical protein ACRCZM_09045 [Bacteroidales bacterium]